MSYQQLTEGRSYQIAALLERGIAIPNIANTVKCHRSTVYRALKPGCHNSPYSPVIAHHLAVMKQRYAAKYRIPQYRIDFIECLLTNDCSPEQISYVLTHIGANVSYEWIYRFIALDKRQGGKLYRHLRQGHKRYRRDKKVRESVINNAVSIDKRPEVVDHRERFGDGEIDTVLGQHGTGAIVTILERKTRFYLAKKEFNVGGTLSGSFR